MCELKLKIDRIILMLAFVLTVISCSTNKGSQNNNRELIFFPPPPDTARIQFLTVINNSIDITGETSLFSKYVTGKENSMSIVKPFGIFAVKDKIFIVDTRMRGIYLLDLNKKTFEFKNPPGLGNLISPISCNADTSGNLYVVDQARKEIVIFDYALNYKNSFGLKIFEKPADVCVYNDRLYVSDITNHKIFVFSKTDNKLISSFPEVNEKDTAFLHQPNHISIMNDVIYVTDFGEFHVKKFDLNGNFIGTVGTYGDGMGQFNRPKGLVADRDDFLYVVDSKFNNIQIFNRLGQLMMFFGGDKSGRGFLASPIKIALDYDNLDFFREYVDNKFSLKYLIYVTNQFGDDKINVYGSVELK